MSLREDLLRHALSSGKRAGQRMYRRAEAGVVGGASAGGVGVAVNNSNKKEEKNSMLKKAKMSEETKNELLHTGTIFGAGIAGTAASTILGKKLGWSDSVKKMTALGGAAALATDYAAVKANKSIGADHSKQASLSNRYLEKIARTLKG